LKDFKFTLLGENLFLHPFKAIYWERHKILLLADLHLGKAAHFRKSGIPIPESIHQPDIERIIYLAEIYKPARIIFLGDLFHSSVNKAWKYFRDFCESRIDIRTELILGNHDILDLANYDFMDVHQDILILHPFILSHKPLTLTELKGYYNLCGHIHPSIRISGMAKQSVRVDCFHFSKNQGILPAFGNFTGNSRMAVNSTDRIFAVTNQKIIPLFQK
jgi:DNA ligase-associated metallophosphoesterase